MGGGSICKIITFSKESMTLLSNAIEIMKFLFRNFFLSRIVLTIYAPKEKADFFQRGVSPLKSATYKKKETFLV